MQSRTLSLVFGAVVTLCLGQVTWWVYFQIRETAALAEAAELLERGDARGAARALGGSIEGGLTEQAHRRRIMFTSEGAALGILVLLGVVFFYIAIQRERRMRQERERFLRGATHELKTPLTTLRLGLDSLANPRLPAAKREAYLQSLGAEVSRLERHVSNLLVAAGLRDHRAAARLESGDLGVEVRSVIDEMTPRFEMAGLTLHVTAIEGTVSRRDPVAWRGIVHNLLDNALKFTPRGGQVEIALRRSDGHAELRVRDSGRGMDPDEVARAFEEFYRGRDDEHVGGAGLGLHLVQQLVAAHGGTVTAHSAGRGRGSELVVRMPLTDTEP